ncbi:hypothetical protein MBLNU230_g6285t1 [Neophaeotheca triangularis]
MFRPPVNRAMRTLDRSFFQRKVPLKAARVFENKNISKLRTQLEKSKDALQKDRLGNVASDPDADLAKSGRKCILLRPEQAKDGNEHPHSPIVSELAQQQAISVIPYDLHLDYSYWTYHDIMSAILPEDDQGEIPSGFSQVGHVAHLNLRDEYLKYKTLIATILMDKNQGVRTVINKIDDVGEENEYRTFKYEVLAGPDDLNVTISEENCTFKFDYSKVYWNSRLNTEHRRLVNLFSPGEAICDVMAGIGPFAVPAGKKGCFVWANDLNPASHASLSDAISRNKVASHVRPFNLDGRAFIRDATAQLLQSPPETIDTYSKPSRKDATAQPHLLSSLTRPTLFTHYVLNLPASALTFLPAFIGLYPTNLRSLVPQDHPLPTIHVYCFSTKSETNGPETLKICSEISSLLNHDMHPGPLSEPNAVQIHDVRDVAPKKRMFCASFRLPADVAFRDV